MDHPSQTMPTHIQSTMADNVGHSGTQLYSDTGTLPTTATPLCPAPDNTAFDQTGGLVSKDPYSYLSVMIPI